jgi:hypothetical protein
MFSWADENWVRTAGYVVVVAACLAIAVRERSRRGELPWMWPAFWVVTAIVYAVMAVGRAGELGSLLSDFGRRQARDEGWYEGRRALQVLVVAAVGAIWLIGVAVAIWRVPERRRRYLPTALVTFTTLCFGGMRVVSLHHVDTLLYRRSIEGARVGALIETVLLLAALVTIAGCRSTAVPPGTRGPRGVVDVGVSRQEVLSTAPSRTDTIV